MKVFPNDENGLLLTRFPFKLKYVKITTINMFNVNVAPLEHLRG